MMKYNFCTVGHSTKFVNDLGITLSLGGDSNLQEPKEIRMRLSVVFYNKRGVNVVPHYLPVGPREELSMNGEISVWGDPEKFSKILAVHMRQRVKK